MENSFSVKYLENADRYHYVVNGSRKWNHPGHWLARRPLTLDDLEQS